jgi:hypothetical protein
MQTQQHWHWQVSRVHVYVIYTRLDKILVYENDEKEENTFLMINCGADNNTN